MMVERWVVSVEVKKASFWLERIMSGEVAKGYLKSLGPEEADCRVGDAMSMEGRDGAMIAYRTPD